MTTGGSGFESGEDFVAARLSIDVPTEGIANLRELTQEIDRFRVSAEAAARIQDDFVQGQRQSADAAERATTATANLVSQMQRAADLQGRLASGSATAGGLNAPGGYVDPFSGAESGRGRAPATLPEAQGQIDALRERDPRAYLNMQAARGNLRQGDVPAETPDEQQLHNAATRVHEREQENTRQQQENPPARHIPPGDSSMADWRQQIGPDASIARQVLDETGGGGRPSAAAAGGLEGGALPTDVTDTTKAPSRPAADAPPRVGAQKKGGGGVAEDSAATEREQSTLSRGAGIAQQVLNEFGPGGSYQGMGGLAMRGLNAASSMGGGAGGALGGLAKGAGVAGLGLTAALAGYGLTQKGGEVYQGFKNQGLVRGGGAAEGIGYEMSIRAMAMNPFLSTEQSRQVIQAALTEGYSGKAFDTVTGFMSSNLREMNLGVAQSVELLRKNVNEGGQSIEGLAANLGVLKEMSKTGVRSLPELQAGFQATSGTLVNAGVSGPVADRNALAAGQMFNDNQALKGTGEQLVQAMTGPQGMAFMRAQGGINMPAGVMPGAMPFLMQGDEMLQGSTTVIKKWALQFHNAGGRPPKGSAKYANAVYQWQLFLQQLGIPWASNASQVREMYDKFVYEGADPFTEGTQKRDEATKQQTQVQDRDFWATVGASAADRAYDVGAQALGGVRATIGNIGSVLTGNFSEIPGRISEQFGKTVDRFTGHGPDEGKYRIPMLDNIMDVYGPGGFEILDKNNKTVKFNPDNREQMDRLSSGEYTYREKGSTGPGISLAQTPQGGDNFKQRVAEVQGTLRIELDPAAQSAGVRVPTTVQLTPHEQKANMGYGDATPNNAPPGESALTRGRGGW